VLLESGHNYYIRMALSENDVVAGEWVVIGTGDLERRVRLYHRYKDHLAFPNDPQIMRGVIIAAPALVGKNVLLNTGCQIDHDCVIGDHSIISPGAIICGQVTLGEKCQIGAGAIILQGVTLDAGTKIPAGTLVVGPDDLRRPQRVLQD
jgi:UDP-3-O-[3-hydroxymyristoyl] glucosamine N-acyltransferase